MRLIDADSLIKRATDSSGSCWDTTCQGTGDFVDYVNAEPTACDIDAIRAEIKKIVSIGADMNSEYSRVEARSMAIVLDIINKYTK